jgi:integrase
MNKLRDFAELMPTTRPLAKDTAANYRRAVNYYGNHIGRDADLSDLDEHRISAWLKAIEDTGYDPGYVRSLRRDLLIVWRFAADCEAVRYPRNRLVRMPRREQEPVTVWPLEWVPRLIQAAKTLQGSIRNYRIGYGVYAEAYFRTQIDLLCRPSDMRKLTWTAITLDSVAFRQSKTSVRHLAKLVPETLESIMRLNGLDSVRVFPLSKSATERLIRKVFKAAGIAKPEGESLGHIRHLGGTTIAGRAGCGAARRALGHTVDSRVFEKHYLDSTKLPDVDYSGWWTSTKNPQELSTDPGNNPAK